MKIADFCGQDTGGQSFKLADAIRRHTPHESHSFRKWRDYLEFPVEFQYGEVNRTQSAWIREYLAGVDVVHVRNFYRYALYWGKTNPKAAWIINQHGRPGDLWPAWQRQDADKRALRVVSTINLLEYADDDPSRWLPAPMDTEVFDRLKAEHAQDPAVSGLKIAHSPTRRDYKGTELLLRVVAELWQEGYPVEVELIEKATHAECLRRKAACHVTFDQIHLQYGNSGLEGMAFGQPTLVGMPRNTYKRIVEIVGYQPFLFVTAETLKQEIRNLIERPQYLALWGERGRRYIEEFHAYPVVATNAIGLYERVLGRA